MKSKSTYQELKKENKILRQKLKSNEHYEKFNNYFISNKAIMLQIHSETKQIIKANETAVNFYGYSENELLQKTINDLNTLPLAEINTLMKKAVKYKSNFFEFKHKLANGKIKDVEIYASPINVDKETHLIVTIIDISNRKRVEQKLKQRENYLTALNKSTEILASGDLKTQMQKFIETIGKVAHASRTYIFKNHTNEKGELLLSQIAEYTAKGIKPEIDNPELQNLSYNNWLPRWYTKLKKGDIINGKVGDFPQTERRILEPQEIKAILTIPILVENEFWGFIGFDNCINDNEWQAVEIEYLKASAEKISTKLIEHRKQKLIENENKRFHATMDSIDAAVYVADMQTYELLFLNKYAKQNWGDKIGSKCYSVLQKGRTEPCEFCTNHLLTDKNRKPKKPHIWEFQNTITKQWYQLRDQAIQWTDRRLVRLEIATDITDRKEAELIINNQNQEYEALNEELRITNDELQIGKVQIQKINSQLIATIKALPDLMFETDSEGRIYNYNAPQPDILYTSPDNFLGKRIDEILPPDCAKICNNAITQAIKNGKHTGAVYSLQLPQGLHWFELSVAAKKENKDERVIMLIRDITKNKEAEKNLKASEENYRLLTETMKDVVVKISTTGKILYLSPAAMKFGGYNNEEEVEGDISKYFADKTDLQNALKLITKVVETHKSGNFEFMYKTKNKATFPVELTYMPLISNNKVYAIQMVLRDITERKEAEKTLKQSEEKYKFLSNQFRLMSDNIPDLVWAKDLNGNFTFVNKAVCEKLLIAKNTQEPIGKKDMFFVMRQRNLFPSRNDWHSFGEVCINSDEVVIKSKKPQRFDEYGNVNGEFIFLDVYKAPIFDNAGKMIGTVGHGRIVTKEKAAEKQLQKQNKEYELLNKKYINQNKELAISKEKAEESNRLKSAFLANMSHEIRTPMNAILGFAGFLKNPTLIPAKRERFVNIINNSGNHLLNLINDIVDISKIDAGQMTIIETECKLNEFLFEIYQFFHSLATQKSEQLEIILHKGLPDGYDTIKTDTTRLRQILINLIGNAVKFTQSGSIEIGYSINNDNMIEFSVKDTGIGISEKDLTVIFKRFRQADETSTRKYGGTGLGLAISKACVDLLGGKIWVNSELKKGTTFNFSIPYKPINSALTKPEIKIDNSQNIFQGKTILIVEDEPFSCLILEEMLEPTQAMIIKAENGLQAIELCKNNSKIDIILMDIQLPKLDGLKATKVIKKIRPDLPIISQTANAMQNDRSKSIEAGCIDYITKPINEKELIEKIAKQIIKE